MAFDDGRSTDDPGSSASESEGINLRRRDFLVGGSAILAGGLAGCPQSDSGDGTQTGSADQSPTPSGTPQGGWPEGADRYFRGLVSELEFTGVTPGEFVYGASESAVMDAYEVVGEDADVSRFEVDDSGVFFTRATRVEVPADVSNPWDVTMKGVVEDRAIEQGDALLGIVYMRSPSSGEDVQPTAQYVAKDEDNQGTNMVRNASTPALGSAWARYNFRIEFDYAAEPGTWWTEIFLGFGQQTVDVGGLALVHWSQDVALEQLPTWQPEYDYEGRAEDAAWRQEAAQRIQDVRKADLAVDVVDGDGNPIEGATVEVSMQEHEFGFGGEFALSQVGDRWDSDAAEMYRQKFLENFNKAALTNALKVSPWSGEWGDAVNADTARRAIGWLLEQDVPVRGHALVWEEWDWMNVDPAGAEERINEQVKERIRDRASEFRGDLPEWDLHNHPIWQRNIRDQIGRDYALEWWATGHDAAPDAQMYVNEMNIIAGSSYREPYDEFISWLIEQDAGVGGIGFMGHFDIEDLTPPEELLSVFDRFANHDVPLQITEFDVQNVNRGDPAQVSAQVDYTHDVLTAAFSHEAIEGVMSWCFWDEEGGARRYYDADWNLRPHGEEYQRLVFGEWWTEESGQTGSEGAYTTRGFKGAYEITATKGERSGSVTTTLSDGGETVEISVNE